ncbi:sodium:proton antiporter [Natrinema sp. 1APR25-10V2]|uniref:cation:proton antiporter n=1 Tax=Natrinema sp. 1APR25-10V2 TaxID=2951081 RepID=UPI0028747323|nr:sodium:proton antiporter [Natrinema sp. 1APR25-10V2]MDS0476732.1 sodium:proton antiporter [Natrinema sp. 1APR25-10V2]
MSAAFELLHRVLSLLVLALAVRIVVDAWLEVPYSVLLILIGVMISVLRVDVGLRLSNEIIMTLVLPIVLFNGVLELDRAALRENVAVPIVLVVVGVPLSVALLGSVGTVAFGLPILVSLLFAAIVVPTDPVAVLSLFEELDAPERLSVVIDGESLFNDGVAIVIVNVLLALAAERTTPTDGLEIAGEFVADVLVVGVGGFLLGCCLGYGATRIIRRIPERMAILLVTVLTAYGSFVLAEHVVGASGILATVGAGLFVEPTVDGDAVDGDTFAFVRDTWEGGAFLLSTLVYVLIGAQVPIASLIDHLRAILVAAGLVLLVRAVIVYGLVGAVNATATRPFPYSYQHVLVWGGLHTVVPIALALGLPAWVAHREFVRAMVFGVAIVGALVQGFLMPSVLRAAGIPTRVSRAGSTEGAS